jgi:uncharacterized phiE125 gp8 family phage protein
MGIQLVTAATAEPLNLTLTKLHCRIEGDQDDEWFKLAIPTARELAETYLGRAIMKQQFLFALDSFPDSAGIFRKFTTQQFSPQQYSIESFLIRGVSEIGGPIYIPYPPLISLDSLKYTDTNGVVQTLAPSAYIVDSISEPGKVTPAFNTFWPQAQAIMNAVQITFTCGWGKIATGADPAQGGIASDVPSSVRLAMLMAIQHWYENREAVNDKGSMMKEVPLGFNSLLGQYRIHEFS